jgi:hypothetical protein
MQDPKQTLARRALLGGAATAGTAAVVASLVPVTPQAPTAVAVGWGGATETPSGYQLTDHVKSYYAKARV